MGKPQANPLRPHFIAILIIGLPIGGYFVFRTTVIIKDYLSYQKHIRQDSVPSPTQLGTGLGTLVILKEGKVVLYSFDADKAIEEPWPAFRGRWLAAR